MSRQGPPRHKNTSYRGTQVFLVARFLLIHSPFVRLPQASNSNHQIPCLPAGRQAPTSVSVLSVSVSESSLMTQNTVTDHCLEFGYQPPIANCTIWDTISSLEKPFRSIELDRQEAAQAPHPLQRVLFTWATCFSPTTVLFAAISMA